MPELYIVLLARDRILRRGLDTLLSRRGHRVLPLENVDEARDIIRRYRPDVVVVERGLVELKPSRQRIVEAGDVGEPGDPISYDAAEVIRLVENAPEQE